MVSRNLGPRDDTYGARRLFKYDIAISVSERGSKVASGLDRLLREQGLRTYFYLEQQRATVGLNGMEHLHAVFGKEAYACVVLASPDYASKAWTRAELQYAVARQMREARTYLMVVQLNEKPTPLPGVVETNFSLSLPRYGLEQTARILAARIRAPDTTAISGTSPLPEHLRGVSSLLPCLPMGILNPESEVALTFFLQGDFGAARAQLEKARKEAPTNGCLRALCCAAWLAEHSAERLTMADADQLNDALTATLLQAERPVLRLAKQLLVILRNDYYDAKNRTASGLPSEPLYREVASWSPTAAELAILSRLRVSTEARALLHLRGT